MSTKGSYILKQTCNWKVWWTPGIKGLSTVVINSKFWEKVCEVCLFFTEVENYVSALLPKTNPLGLFHSAFLNCEAEHALLQKSLRLCCSNNHLRNWPNSGQRSFSAPLENIRNWNWFENFRSHRKEALVWNGPMKNLREW